MDEFFIHADPYLWKRFLSPGLYDNILKTDYYINRVMNVIDEYYHFRLTETSFDFTDKVARLGLVQSFLSQEGLLSLVRVEWYDHLLDVLWHSLKIETQKMQEHYDIHFTGVVFQNDTFIGITGEGVEKSAIQSK